MEALPKYLHRLCVSSHHQRLVGQVGESLNRNAANSTVVLLPKALV